MTGRNARPQDGQLAGCRHLLAGFYGDIAAELASPKLSM
jgi:hypothetical protein